MTTTRAQDQPASNGKIHSLDVTNLPGTCIASSAELHVIFHRSTQETRFLAREVQTKCFPTCAQAWKKWLQPKSPGFVAGVVVHHATPDNLCLLKAVPDLLPAKSRHALLLDIHGIRSICESRGQKSNGTQIFACLQAALRKQQQQWCKTSDESQAQHDPTGHEADKSASETDSTSLEERSRHKSIPETHMTSEMKSTLQGLENFWTSDMQQKRFAVRMTRKSFINNKLPAIRRYLGWCVLERQITDKTIRDLYEDFDLFEEYMDFLKLHFDVKSMASVYASADAAIAAGICALKYLRRDLLHRERDYRTDTIIGGYMNYRNQLNYLHNAVNDTTTDEFEDPKFFTHGTALTAVENASLALDDVEFNTVPWAKAMAAYIYVGLETILPAQRVGVFSRLLNMRPTREVMKKIHIDNAPTFLYKRFLPADLLDDDEAMELESQTTPCDSQTGIAVYFLDIPCHKPPGRTKTFRKAQHLPIRNETFIEELDLYWDVAIPLLTQGRTNENQHWFVRTSDGHPYHCESDDGVGSCARGFYSWAQRVTKKYTGNATTSAKYFRHAISTECRKQCPGRHR